MTKIILTKTSFTAGEIDPALYGRIDLRAYDEGAATLTNVLVQRTGGLERRPGTTFLTTVPSGGRLYAFDHGAIHDLLVFGDYEVHILTNGVHQQTLSHVPWSIYDVAQIDLTLVDDAVLVCHPSYTPRVLKRVGGGQWSSEQIEFAPAQPDDDANETTLQPFIRYVEADVSIQPYRLQTDQGLPDPTAGSNIMVRLVTSRPVFTSDHVGVVVRIKGRQLLITQLEFAATGSNALARTLEPLVDELATIFWDEQAFSNGRGFPAVAAMHQNRLVFGGCRDCADYIWFSRSGRPFDFNMAGGEDDAAIAFRIVAERRHEIRQMFSGRVLQVFTTAGEWTVGGFPLTPGNARVELQTRVGSLDDRQIAPVDVDGATLFVGSTGRDLREFLFTETEQAYQAADIAILSRHMMRDPVDAVFDQQRRILWIARADGRACAVTIDRNSNIVAWSLQETDGHIRALAMQASGALVMLVDRAAGLSVERLDDDALVDSQRSFTAAEPSTSWSGLEALDGQTFVAIADGDTLGERTIAGGHLDLPAPASLLQLGLGFAHAVAGLPITGGGSRGVAADAPYRPVRISLRIGPSKDLLVDTGTGLRGVSLGEQAAMNDIFDVGIRAMGWRRGTAMPPWRLAQAQPGPFKLLSVTVEAKVNG
jgi:hypothetical protein